MTYNFHLPFFQRRFWVATVLFGGLQMEAESCMPHSMTSKSETSASPIMGLDLTSTQRSDPLLIQR